MNVDSQTWLLIIMSVFTGVAAISLLLMLGMMFGMYKSVEQMRTRSTQFLDRVEPTTATAQKALEQFREQSGAILSDVKRLTEKSQLQMERVDSILSDLQTTTRTQVTRVDETFKTNLDRFEQTASALNDTIVKPVKHIRAVAIGVDAALRQLAVSRRRRPTVDRATLDEEMFI